ncbi:MAG: hypothetical protein ABI183_26375 [Polyangiaceae bacterium]
MCPHCRKNAPIVYRGVVAYCTACGQPRAPLTDRSVNMAGQPSKVGGTVANVFGWMMIAGGLITALLIGALFQAILPAGIFGWILGIVIGVVSIGIGGSFVYGGKSLKKSGTSVEKDTRERAIFALAQNRGGVLTAFDVAAALGMSAADADAMLTDYAKTDSDRVRLEVDDAGAITYVFPQHGWMGPRIASADVAGSYAAGSSDESEAEQRSRTNRR